MKKVILVSGLALFSLTAIWAQNTISEDREECKFKLTSETFENDTTLPPSMIYNYVQNGLNVCGLNGQIGQDQSPELSWTDAPRETRSFAVIAFDVTAGFTHWGMYNISGERTKLPDNAGVAGSSYGAQVTNGFGDMSYDGPCPPNGVKPYVHRYVFTIYALDKTLDIGSTNFPASADGLLDALLDADRTGHVLATSRLTGFYSTTPE
jgi:Raf kinase inhibitor-like YbhB/YbcL family protein